MVGVGGTRKFYNIQVYSPAEHALGHVAFADYPATVGRNP